MNKLLDSIDLSYEDFEKRDKKKGHKGQNRNKKSLKGKKDRLHIQSIEQRIAPLSCQTNKNSKQSSKKKPHTRSLVGSNNENSNNIRSCNALSRQKSRSNW
jgi:pantothenate kinase